MMLLTSYTEVNKIVKCQETYSTMSVYFSISHMGVSMDPTFDLFIANASRH